MATNPVLFWDLFQGTSCFYHVRWFVISLFAQGQSLIDNFKPSNLTFITVQSVKFDMLKSSIRLVDSQVCIQLSCIHLDYNKMLVIQSINPWLSTYVFRHVYMFAKSWKFLNNFLSHLTSKMSCHWDISNREQHK